MNIKILDSWLRKHLKTDAPSQKIAESLSLTSVSVERIEKIDNDFVYDIEVTTNRPDLMSVVGLAREAATVLPQFGVSATFIPLKLASDKRKTADSFPISIKNDPKLVNRICAVVMEVTIKDSPTLITKRLEASGIRSLNNLVDVTNYVMREIGHPAHVFDYNRLNTKTLIIRESKKGEKIVTLDKKEHILSGGDIVADNGKGEIVDLLGIMGTANSAVTNYTKRILFFIDNNKPSHIRKTSMSLGIRSEAAVLNEKAVDPELAMVALLHGISLYKEVANSKLISPIIDIYPNKVKSQTVSITSEKINALMDVSLPMKTTKNILTSLGFQVRATQNTLTATVPSWRANDVSIEEDIIEEIARVYGYHRLPSLLPPLSNVTHATTYNNQFYWEKRVKNALKYWGFTESYTYSFVSENLLEGPTEEAVELANPLTEDMVYLRRTIVPSLLQVIHENTTKEEIKIFEIANVYKKIENDLPKETPMLAGVFKKENASFYEVKGMIEQLLADCGIKKVSFRKRVDGGDGAEIYIQREHIGNIEILQKNIIDFELNFESILKYATNKKTYKPLPKYPPVIEDIRIVTDPKITYADIVATIKKQSDLVINVSLLDKYENKQTFRITYQHPQKTLTDEEVAKVRENIIHTLEKELNAEIS